MPIAEPVRAEVLAEDMRLNELGAGVETLEDEFVFVQRGGYEEAVVEDAEDKGVEAVRDGG